MEGQALKQGLLAFLMKWLEERFVPDFTTPYVEGQSRKTQLYGELLQFLGAMAPGLFFVFCFFVFLFFLFFCFFVFLFFCFFVFCFCFCFFICLVLFIICLFYYLSIIIVYLLSIILIIFVAFFVLVIEKKYLNLVLQVTKMLSKLFWIKDQTILVFLSILFFIFFVSPFFSFLGADFFFKIKKAFIHGCDTNNFEK